MATKTKLTETACRQAKPNSKTWDTEIKGFGLFCGQASKTFYYQRDVRGKTVRERLGNWPDVSVAAARGDVHALAAAHVKGITAKRMAAPPVPTLEQTMERYLARPKLRSEHNNRAIEAQIRNNLGHWLDLPLDEIDRDMCATMHERLSISRISKDVVGRAHKIVGPVAANNVMRSFRTIWNYALRRVELPMCPTIAIEWHPEEPPKTIIDDLDKWLREVNEVENEIHQAYYLLLLMTGLRRNEAQSLRWEHINDDHLHLPMTKNGRPFDLPLFDVHHAIMNPLRVHASEFVFPGKRNSVHLKSPTPITWSPHAHRRTFATVAEHDAGLHETTVGHLINHTSSSVTGRRYVAGGYEKLRQPMGEVVAAFKR